MALRKVIIEVTVHDTVTAEQVLEGTPMCDDASDYYMYFVDARMLGERIEPYPKKSVEVKP